MKKKQKRMIAVMLTAVLAIGSLATQPTSTMQAATKKVSAIKLNATKKTMFVGETATLKVKKVTPAKGSKVVTWKSSNKKVASVTAKGKVTAKKAGMVKITATSKSNKKVKATCTIMVKNKPVVDNTSKETNTSVSTQTTNVNNNESPSSNSTSSSAKNPSETVSPTRGDIIHSGSYGSTYWTIDKNGLLEVTGTGDMYPVVLNTSYENFNSTLPGWLMYSNEIKSAKIEVTGATHLEYMFYECAKLASVDVSKLDTSNVTNMYSMFASCWELTNLDLNMFDTSNVTNMNNMFSTCWKLTNLNLSGFDISNVTSMQDMFGGCDKLTIIQTPKKSGKTVPDLPTNTWQDAAGNTYTTLPENATESITLTKK